MDTHPIHSNSLEKFYYINGNQFGQQYKLHLSDYQSWDQLDHCQQWILFPNNIGSYLSIDETSVSNGELYTIITNKEAKGKKGALVAIFEGTSSEKIIPLLQEIPKSIRKKVKEVTLDMAGSMNKIVRKCFPNAERVIDRFHVQKLAYDAIQEMRIAHRWEVINQETNEIQNAKDNGEKHISKKLDNGDTLRQLLARSRYLLFKSKNKWTSKQKCRAEILFNLYPDLKQAYDLTHSLRLIFSKTKDKAVAYTKLARWYNDVTESGFKSFNSISATIYAHYTEILNFFDNRNTNASAESFNAKIKAFRASMRGIVDIPFFLFRLAKIYA